MINRRTVLAGGSAAVLAAVVAGPARANKSAVAIEAPESAQKGSEVTVKLNVTHRGNTAKHHTEWVCLKVNGEEAKRWEYTGETLPETEDFSVEYKVKADAALKLEAEAHCNIHGSAGPATREVKLT